MLNQSPISYYDIQLTLIENGDDPLAALLASCGSLPSATVPNRKILQPKRAALQVPVRPPAQKHLGRGKKSIKQMPLKGNAQKQRRRRTRKQDAETQTTPSASMETMTVPTTNETVTAISQIENSSSTSSTTESVRIESVIPFTNPVEYIREIYDTDILPLLQAPDPLSLSIKQHLYRIHVLKLASSTIESYQTTEISLDTLFLITIDIFQKCGLIPLSI